MVQEWRRICEPVVDEPYLSMDLVRQWVMLARKATEAARFSKSGCTKEQIMECRRKIIDHFKAAGGGSSDADKQKMMKEMSSMFQSSLKPGCDTVDYEDMLRMNEKWYPMQD